MRKSKKAKAHIPSNRIGKNRCISFPANVGYRTAISDLERGGMAGGNLLHLAEHFFFMFSLLFVRTLCLFSHCFLSFYSSSSFCFAGLISHLRFFFLLLFITLGLFFLSFFLTLSSTLCIIILGLFCFDMYALVDRGLFTFSLLFYCYYYLASCCLVVLFGSFSIL